MTDEDAAPARPFLRQQADPSESRWRTAHRENEPVRGSAQFQRAQRVCNMPTDVETGQTWSTWVPGRRQWLLATVTSRKDRQATLLCDPRYGMGSAQSELTVDVATMLTASNLFRYIEPAS